MQPGEHSSPCFRQVRRSESQFDLQLHLMIFRRSSRQIWGGRVVRWCWVNLQCRGVLLIWMSRARAYCASNGCGWGLFGHFYSRLSFLFFFLPLAGRWSDIDCAVKLKTTNQPTTRQIRDGWVVRRCWVNLSAGASY